MIALIAAVSLETSLFRAHLGESVAVGPFEGFRGTIAQRDVLLMHSGIGKSAAATATTALVETFRPSLIVSFGCGGAYAGTSLDVGDVAVAVREIFGDEGVLTPDKFLTLEDLGLPSAEKAGVRYFNTFPVDMSSLESVSAGIEAFAASRSRKALQGPFVTVSTCCGTLAAGMEMARRTGGVCENMEGAAVAQVCALYDVPFLEVRGISNMVEDRDASRWDLRSAALIAQEALMHVLPLLPGN